MASSTLRRTMAAVRKLGIESAGEIARVAALPASTVHNVLRAHRKRFAREQAATVRRGHLTDLWSLHSDEEAS